MDPVYFRSPEELRTWLAENHETETELLAGLYKKKSGKPSITWAEAVDELLCYGWIDGLGKRIDDERYTIRFTPRKKESIWSDRNIKRVEVLTREGRMQPAGLRAFEARSEERSRVYSFERESEAELGTEYERKLQDNRAAREFFNSQAPWYQRAAKHWVVSAKREVTRDRRMDQLIEDSANGRTVKPLTRKA